VKSDKMKTGKPSPLPANLGVPPTTVDRSRLDTEIAQLADLALRELRARWLTLYGRPAPRFFRRKLLLRALAYQMRVQVHGGLSDATKRRLRQIAAATADGALDADRTTPRIKPGTKLIRSYREAVHSVLVLEEGFEWEGRRYDSLSAIATAITGTRWNGWTFFGLKRSGPMDDHDVRGKFRRPSPGPDGAVSWLKSRKAKARTHGEGARA
jgi:Protein of unknown function (DUF2924)